jgi:hypothetical protein
MIPQWSKTIPRIDGLYWIKRIDPEEGEYKEIVYISHGKMMDFGTEEISEIPTDVEWFPIIVPVKVSDVLRQEYHLYEAGLEEAKYKLELAQNEVSSMEEHMQKLLVAIQLEDMKEKNESNQVSSNTN